MAFLILRVGSTFEGLRAARGDYDDWFVRDMGLAPEDARVVAPAEGEPLPDASERFDGIVISGSAAMVTDAEPWSEATATWLLPRITRDEPILGVCYGHQLLAHALGGEVAHNPLGRQVGSVSVTLTALGCADPLLGRLPETHIQQASHSQSVLRPPRGAQVLGHTARDPFHVLRFAPRVWGVQFHPEFDHVIVPYYITERREPIRSEGWDPDALLDAVQPSPHGRALLRRFVTLCRAREIR
jgi:GMP synthase (glutamine-hydrolysing)